MHAASMIKALVAVLAASSPAFAELAVTAPIGTTTCTGGQSCLVSWEDNHIGVSLLQQGNCTVALYTGGSQQQTFLQPIAFPDAINVTTTGSIQFVVDPTVGENDNNYFIRFSSTTLNNPSNAAQPYLSFSSKFTLNGMTGHFNSSVQAQISSATSAPASTATSTRLTTAVSRTSTSASRSATTTGGAVSSGVNGVFVAGAALVAGVAALF